MCDILSCVGGCFMEKELKNYRNNLLIIFICYVVVILFNTQLFTVANNIIPCLYGIFMIILGILSLYCLVMIEKDILKSAKVAIIIGPMITLSPFVGDLIYKFNLIENFRVTGWFFMIGGILIYRAGKKIIKNSL